MQAEGVVGGRELERWRASWAAAAEAQWAAAAEGRFKESAAQFLTSSWQGEALAVRASVCVGGVATQGVAAAVNTPDAPASCV
jgi:hypothetical protein